METEILEMLAQIADQTVVNLGVLARKLDEMASVYGRLAEGLRNAAKDRPEPDNAG